MTKTAVVIIGHQSERRLTGNELMQNCLNSITASKSIIPIVVDNYSFPHPLNVPSHLRITSDVPGLTGAWEIGVNYALETTDAEIIIISNDDVVFSDEFFHQFISNGIDHHPQKDMRIFGPLSNGQEGYFWQKSNMPKPYKLEESKNMVNGFCFALTRNCIEMIKSQNNGLLFDHTKKWGGNEEVFQQNIKSFGVTPVIIHHAWLKHYKIHGWKTNKLR